MPIVDFSKEITATLSRYLGFRSKATGMIHLLLLAGCGHLQHSHFQKDPDRTVAWSGLQNETQASAWATRGWTFQESMLSPRLLFFGKHQLYWECQTTATSEDDFDWKVHGTTAPKTDMYDRLASSDDVAQNWSQMLEAVEKSASTLSEQATTKKDKLALGTIKYMSKGLSFKPVLNATKTYLRVTSLLPYGDIGQGIKPTRITLNFGEFVREYTARKLTDGTDKLIAFEGFASVVSKRTRQNIHAGIWAGELAKSLFWFADQNVISKSEAMAGPFVELGLFARLRPGRRFDWRFLAFESQRGSCRW